MFNETQRNYSTTERELLALILAARKWKGLFWDKKFHTKTDHKPLLAIKTHKDPYGRIARWMMELDQFNFKIDYIPGVENIAPDSLS